MKKSAGKGVSAQTHRAVMATRFLPGTLGMPVIGREDGCMAVAYRPPGLQMRRVDP